ncbi:MAG: PrsW family intramembrane metalloprotease [Nannocystaceae bacterium]|nr:PrsW family intramembrane metalloprotease [Nannocystaceae bacterium]
MPAQFQLALFGALPAILAMAYVDRLDAKRPEPRRTLRLVALAGALSGFVVVALGGLLRPFGPEVGTYAAAFYDAFVVAAGPEEAAKLACVLIVAWRRPEFDERMDGIVYGARAGLGFALVENVVYLLIVPHSLGEFLSLFVARALLAVPGHAAWGAILGYFAARRRFDRRGPGMLGGYLMAVMLHGLYDASLFAVPVAIAHGHTTWALGIWGVPVFAYAPPLLIILGSVVAMRLLAAQAVAADDRALP